MTAAGDIHIYIQLVIKFYAENAWLIIITILIHSFSVVFN